MPNVVNLAKHDARRRTCWSCVTATGPACSRTCSTNSVPRGLNVQETENIIFEGAEAAVARINLDGEPSPSVAAALRDAISDILDVRVVPL